MNGYGELPDDTAEIAARVVRMTLANELSLRLRLESVFRVPAEFMDTAVKIWWDGKED